jgi:hypothetical protein
MFSWLRVAHVSPAKLISTNGSSFSALFQQNRFRLEQNRFRLEQNRFRLEVDFHKRIQLLCSVPTEQVQVRTEQVQVRTEQVQVRS